MKKKFTLKEDFFIADACYKIFSALVSDDKGNDSRFLISGYIAGYEWEKLFSTDTWNKYLKYSEDYFHIGYIESSFYFLEQKFPKEIKKVKKLMKKDIFSKNKKCKIEKINKLIKRLS